ncbi:hypothetical protein Leryth_014150 [Lithospermum erythrorhizon]|nr:hypothetical protein Leryth_014150 [Lithospermum erythrorhizon]
MAVKSIFQLQPYSMLLNLLFFLLFICSSHCDELQILMHFKSTLKEPILLVFHSWIPDNHVCNFTGIVCDRNEKVKEINLAEKNLSGTVSFDSLCSLELLERVSLGSNFLVGSISDHLMNCTSLKYLDLGFNSFSGNVPALSSLSKLKFLNLNLSGFTGAFPWKSLRNLTNLTFLSLGDNLFDRSPFPLEVLNLQNLYWLYLSNCSIEGQISESIGNLTLLENLELSHNYLSGRIPDGITKLTKLRQLELYENSLTGDFPVGFGNLTSLVSFDCSSNNLEGDISELRFLTKLVSLQLFENNFSGEIPEEFGEFRFLEDFSLYTNQFTGSLPQKIGSWADFNFIDVSENSFSGPIPPEMCSKDKLTDLLMLQNKFIGGLPATYGNCSSLVRLRVKNNSLSGIVPTGIWSLPNLSLIDLALNQFEGPIAPNIGEAKFLAQLCLANNRFSGVLPETISEDTSLVAIDLSLNQFSGNIPSTVGKLQTLSSLHLENNFFTGPIPDSLGSCVSLADVNFASNLLSAKIPASLGYLPSLNSLNLSNNNLSGEIPESFSSSRLSLLDLANNELVGHVPSSLLIFKSSFTGNPGLCIDQNGDDLKSCSSNYNNAKGHNKTILMASCFIVGALVLLFSLSYFLYMKSRKSNQEIPIRSFNSWDMKQFHVLQISEEHIIKALKQENLIGKGGSGNVYKVVLAGGEQIAVKHILNGERSRSCGASSTLVAKENGRSSEFDAEVAMLSSIRHVNVVKLYCSITSEDSSLLVYEYLPNGSLWDKLHCSYEEISTMDWKIRYDIAVGAAKGLEYLHHGCKRLILHRDVKSSNILLDEHMKPRIADFGLAKILQASGERDSASIVAGTYGYMAPEYAYTTKVDQKSDVYSFGVVLLELVTGKKPVEKEFGEYIDIVHWVCSSIAREKNMVDLVDSGHRVERRDAAEVLVALCTAPRMPSLRDPP